MGKVIYLPVTEAAVDAADMGIPYFLHAIESFAERAEAERAAAQVRDHLGFPDLVAVVERRSRLRARFDLAVDSTDADRASAVLRISARSG